MNSSTNTPQHSSSRSKETADSLLQSFQSYDPRKRPATARRPSMPPYPTTPGSQAEATGNNQTNSQKSPPATPKATEANSAGKQSTPTPKTSKRPLRTPFYDGSSSDESTNTHNHDSGVKRPRHPTAATRQPDRLSVENGRNSPLFFPDTVQDQPMSAEKLPITLPKKPPPTETPQAWPPTSSASAVQDSDRQSVVHRLSTENKRVANDLAQRNSAFLETFPAGGNAYFEARLDAITKEIVALHQQKVDAVKAEYIEKLQKEMSECQKMISMLQKAEEGS
ncbi:uncharacterized protein TRUGW13939_01654 [Talaromyces rugulosus]|uniref:Uncharacterized protein n=1 Tax=Talaromyces rugulosus TaxID=121627 RepID=A0A7H8QKX3_TALRU|nr:uncharacterized protein TRUGW13939_01654 [Talaromyces rugulosus]QKX54567.1 hypothetical protein TRUGW13939_01654 [Talaromyces rugulosus]